MLKIENELRMIYFCIELFTKITWEVLSSDLLYLYNLSTCFQASNLLKTLPKNSYIIFLLANELKEMSDDLYCSHNSS